MTDIDNSKEVAETDMLVNMMANTEKIVSTNKRVNYNDIKNNKDDDDELDVEANDFISKKDNANNDDNKSKIFSKHDEGHDNEINNKTNNTKGSTINKDNHTEYSKHTAHSSSDSDGVRAPTGKELKRLKLDMLRKLGELKQSGVNLSQNFSLDSDLEDMEFEYKLHSDIRAKQNSVKWMSHMLIGLLKGGEILNDNYNPFDIKLTGLSDKVSTDITNYYTVLGEIYEKYNQPGKEMDPVFKLLFMISGSVLSLQVNNAIPALLNNMNMGSPLRNDDEALNLLRKKAEEDSKRKQIEADYYKKQHEDASKIATDMKLIKDREMELQRLNKLKNTKIDNVKNSLLLSSDTEREPTITKQDINRINKEKYAQEQKHLETMRKLAHEKSEIFRSANTVVGNDKKKRDLERQNKQLDNIISSVEDKKKKKSNDNDSEKSNASSISINPNIGSIFNKSSSKSNNKPNQKNERFNKQLESFVDNFDNLDIESNKDKSKQKKTKTSDIVDFGEISFGTKNKGTKSNIVVGKTFQ